MLEEMPSSELSNSRKWRLPPKIMSRMTRRLHLSPIASSVRLIAQPDLVLAMTPLSKTGCIVAPVYAGYNQLRNKIGLAKPPQTKVSSRRKPGSMDGCGKTRSPWTPAFAGATLNVG
jgi:hypothetical protein